MLFLELAALKTHTRAHTYACLRTHLHGLRLGRSRLYFIVIRRLAGVASLWLLSVNDSGGATSLHQINGPLTQKKLPSPDAFRSHVIIEAISPPQQRRRRTHRRRHHRQPGRRNNGSCSPYRALSATAVHWVSHAARACVMRMRARA